MKANRVIWTPQILRNSFLFIASPGALGLLAVVLVVPLSSAGQKPVVSSTGGPLAESLRLDLGTIGITSPSQPARYGLNKAKGQIQSASDGAGNAARAVLNTPDMHEGTLQAVVGALG